MSLVLSLLRLGGTAAGRSGVALLFLVVSAAAPAEDASAQNVDINGEPYFGTIRVSSGFSDDPRTVAVRAGGSQDARDLGSGCRGNISTRPDLRVHYSAGSSLPLNIYAESDEDLTLVINRPDGSWICNDDYNGLNPAVLMDNPQSGRYDVWVGVYGGNSADGTVYVSELTPRFGQASRAASASNGGVNPNAEPTYQTIRVSSGFSNDPRTVSVRAGGSQSADGLGSGCRGSIATRPDVRVHYSAGSTFPLNIYAVSDDDDLTLVVRRPDGSWSCNDDHSGLNPAVLMSQPQSGQYDIWVGVYGGGFGDSTLYISELSPTFP